MDPFVGSRWAQKCKTLTAEMKIDEKTPEEVAFFINGVADHLEETSKQRDADVATRLERIKDNFAMGKAMIKDLSYWSLNLDVDDQELGRQFRQGMMQMLSQEALLAKLHAESQDWIRCALNRRLVAQSWIQADRLNIEMVQGILSPEWLQTLAEFDSYRHLDTSEELLEIRDVEKDYWISRFEEFMAADWISRFEILDDRLRRGFLDWSLELRGLRAEPDCEASTEAGSDGLEAGTEADSDGLRAEPDCEASSEADAEVDGRTELDLAWSAWMNRRTLGSDLIGSDGSLGYSIYAMSEADCEETETIEEEYEALEADWSIGVDLGADEAELGKQLRAALKKIHDPG